MGDTDRERARAATDHGDDASVDEVLGRLERVVDELEAGDLSLEDALLRFEEGVKLARRGSRLLDALEQRVEIMLADREDPVPFVADSETKRGRG
jgi:exodeoxyribonuclease VII small subunit